MIKIRTVFFHTISIMEIGKFVSYSLDSFLHIITILFAYVRNIIYFCNSNTSKKIIAYEKKHIIFLFDNHHL